MKRIIAGIILTMIIGTAAQAGFGPFIEDITITDLGEGNTMVEGSLVGVRFTKDDVQQLGCRIRGNMGGVPNVVCLGRDINENNHFCFSTDPALIEAAKSISPFSYVNFVYDEFAQCTSLIVSVRSHHIPDKFTEKSKSK